ncbi:MAG TPA: IPTL-CTERM sorting domain-containing protein [Thermoanaerobaculia bacterium]|nr:IPTL-CTERM sorting domain-containing protein [Thermoanaerobaculia bacterium]
MAKRIGSLLSWCGLLLALPLAAQPNVRVDIQGDLGLTPREHFTETVVDLGTDPTSHSAQVVTQDCSGDALGFGPERYEFTLTAPTDVIVTITDCCVAGDRFEVRINDSDFADHDQDCIVGRQETSVAPDVPDEVARVTLAAGSYALRVRDVAFQCDGFDACPAGFEVQIDFDDPTDVAPVCLEECGGQAFDIAIPTTSAWGLGALAALLLLAGGFALRRLRG